jgi:hypothetical protein
MPPAGAGSSVLLAVAAVRALGAPRELACMLSARPFASAAQGPKEGAAALTSLQAFFARWGWRAGCVSLAHAA